MNNLNEQTAPSPGAFTLQASVLLNWGKSDQAECYDVIRTGNNENVKLADSITQTNYTDMAPQNGVENAYIITAKNEAGTTDSNPSIVTIVNIAPVLAPPPPTAMQIGFLPVDKADALQLPIARTRAEISTGGGITSITRYKGKATLAISLVYIGKTFPTKDQLATYKSKAAAYIAKIPAGMNVFIVVENEPNYNERNGDVNVYAEMLKAIVEICQPRNIKVYIGGITYWALAAYCYQLYVADKNTTAMQVFKDAHSTSGNNDAIAFIADLLPLIKDVNVHFNFHVYINDKSLATLQLVCAKVRQIVGNKLVIAGEIGISAQKPEYVTATLNAMRGNVDAAIFYDGAAASSTGAGEGDVKFTPAMDSAVKSFL